MEVRVGFDHLIKQLLQVIPQDEISLINDLNKLLEKWFNVAPELRKNDEYWDPIKFVLAQHICEFETMWKAQVLYIYNSGGIHG